MHADTISNREIETDYVLFEFGPSRRTDNSGNHSDQLANALPSPIAKALFHYYCNVASPFLTTMGNSGQNPLLHLCTPWNLFDTMCPASTAVRMSILSISAAYLAHETSQSSFAAEISPQWPEQKRTVIEMGIKFKHAALSNIFLADTNTASTVQRESSKIPDWTKAEWLDQMTACWLPALSSASVMSSQPTRHGTRT